MNPLLIASLAQTFWTGVISGFTTTSAQEAVRNKPKTELQLTLDKARQTAIIVRVPKTKQPSTLYSRKE